MPRDVTPITRAKLAKAESLGFRVGIGEEGGRWIATAKRDADGQFHVSKASSELEVIDRLLESIGILPDNEDSIE